MPKKRVGPLQIDGENLAAILQIPDEKTKKTFLRIVTEGPEPGEGVRLRSSKLGQVKYPEGGYYLLWRETPPPPKVIRVKEETAAVQAQREREKEPQPGNFAERFFDWFEDFKESTKQ